MIDVMILGIGLYYLLKEKEGRKSRKIYGIISGAGGTMTIFMIA